MYTYITNTLSCLENEIQEQSIFMYYCVELHINNHFHELVRCVGIQAIFWHNKITNWLSW